MSQSRAVGAVVVTLVLVVTAGVVPWVAGATGSDARSAGRASAGGAASTAASTPDELVAAQSVDPDTVLLRADVAANGTARWRIEYLVRLDDENATDAFESVAADIRNDSTPYTDRFAERIGRTVRAAENATGREMAVAGVTVETERQDLGAEYGVVRYEFTWTNFAVANDTTLRIGDALGGFFLDSETQLTLAWPAGYTAVTVDPPADESAATEVVWQGQRSFSAAGPRVVASTTAPPTTDGPGEGGSGSGSALLVGGLAVVALAALGGGLLLARRRGGLPAPTGTGGSGSDGDGATADASGDAAGDAAAAASDPPEELLSNEERVLRLLEERGGRIKQQEIAGELDWTDAKTSQVVKGLRENDEVEVFRLGRENVVSLPGENDI